MAKPKTVMSSYVRTRREAMGLSQKQFSQRVGVYQSYVSLVEKGEKIIDPVLAARWAKRMRVPQQDFVQIALADLFRKENVRLTVAVSDLRGNEAVQYEGGAVANKAPNRAKRANVQKKTGKTKRAKIEKQPDNLKRVTEPKNAMSGKRATNAEKPAQAKRAKQGKNPDQPKRATAKKTSKSAKRAESVETPVVYEQVDNVTEFPAAAVA